MVFIAGEGVNSTEGDRASLLDWRSHRIKRQCRSTLAAETMAMDAAMDAGLFARELMAEVMIPSYVPLQACRKTSRRISTRGCCDGLSEPL